MNSGEHLWWVPTGETPNQVKNHPALQNVDLSRTGGGGPAISMVMGDLVVMTDGRRGDSVLHAINKRTGDRLGTVEIPSNGQYGMMTYLHDGKQFVVVQIGGAEYPSSLVALALP